MIYGCVEYENSLQAYEPPIFDQVCEALEVDCTDIAPPTIVYSSILMIIGELTGSGYYGVHIPDEPYIYINSVLTPIDRVDEIITHEMTHYVAHQAGLGLTYCESEETARRVTAELTNFEYDDDWRAQYGCTAPAQ